MTKAFRVPLGHLDAVRRMLGARVHDDGSAWIVSAAAARYLERSDRRLRNFEPHPIDPDRWAGSVVRLHNGWSLVVSEPLPASVSHEAHLMLYANRGLELEFMGRGRIASERHLPVPADQLLELEEPGGKRCYLFRRLLEPGFDTRMQAQRDQYGGWSRWISDSGARIVVSLGGGGFRLFAATPVLKMIDRLANGRDHIAEVWGSSGGAFLGYLYAAGFRMETVDQFAFDLYNGRVPHLVDGSLSSIARSRLRAAVNQVRGRDTPPEMVDWLRELERREPVGARCDKRPFYAIASSTKRAGLTALAATDHVSELCRDFMVPCDPQLGVAASTAVPFVLRPVNGIGDSVLETWFDGSVNDENPLALPYVKWMRERTAYPDRTPQRLKIVLVILNLRLSESQPIQIATKLPVLRSLEALSRGTQLIDRLLDSKTITNVQIVTAMPGVEVLTVKLNLGWLSAQDPSDIARAVRSGRTMASWDVTLHGAP
jgi:hypothetical protein